MSSSAQEPSQGQQHDGVSEEQISKGKGKATEDTAMDVSDEDEDDDYEENEGEPEEADEDNMEEIDEDNIVGKRTRGKTIDFAQAAKDLEGEEDDDDEEDDEDFEAEDEEMAD